MTSNPSPSTARVPDPPSPGGAAPGEGFGVTILDRIDPVEFRDRLRSAAAGVVWFMARCNRCAVDSGTDNGQPFRDEVERDDWAAKHTAGTGHVVHLTIDGLDAAPDLHMTGIISRDPHGQYRFVCPADNCGTSNGPYGTAETAIASWRQHKPSRPAR